MRIVVFGATGATGRLVVAQALARGHGVTAFVRARGKPEDAGGDLRVVEGDLTDRAAVSGALRGQDAVVSTLGAAKPWRPSPDIVQGVGVVIAAMKETGVDRFVYMSALGVGESRGAVRGSVLGLMVPLMLKAAFADHTVDEQALRDSGLAWTIVRPTLLTNGAATGRWRSGPEVTDPFPLGRIPRADVAAFILGVLDRARMCGRPSTSSVGDAEWDAGHVEREPRRTIATQSAKREHDGSRVWGVVSRSPERGPPAPSALGASRAGAASSVQVGRAREAPPRTSRSWSPRRRRTA